VVNQKLDHHVIKKTITSAGTGKLFPTKRRLQEEASAWGSLSRYARESDKFTAEAVRNSNTASFCSLSI